MYGKYILKYDKYFNLLIVKVKTKKNQYTNGTHLQYSRETKEQRI